MSPIINSTVHMTCMLFFMSRFTNFGEELNMQHQRFNEALVGSNKPNVPEICYRMSGPSTGGCLN